MENSHSGPAHKQQAVCQPLPHSPCACLDRHPYIQPQSSSGGRKRVPTAPCPHRALLAQENDQTHQISRDFLCVCPFTQQLYTYTPWWCVCALVNSRQHCSSPALCELWGWSLRQCLLGECSAGSIFTAVLGSQPAFPSSGTSTPVSGPAVGRVCLVSRPDGGSRSSCGMGEMID